MVVDLELSRRQKQLGVGVIALALAGISVAVAAVPTSFSAGQVLKASDLNANFASLDGRVAVFERRSAVVAKKNNTQMAAFNIPEPAIFPLEELDANNEFDPLTGTFTPSSDGIYTATCTVLWNGTGSNNGCTLLMLVKNDVGGAQTIVCGPLGTDSSIVTSVIALAANDRLRCDVLSQLAGEQSFGGTQNFEVERNYFSIARVR
ncbi:MAG: hypothetical protein H0T89_12190 [Deltaproteobacteria bacterium]|nr:hypothetical protein [Deltaproteobacteria bacterium]